MNEAVCLVIDTGDSASQQPPSGASFLNAALECASMFVSKKLFSESKEVFGVVLFGTEETNNPLADLGDSYQNIKFIERGFCRADWETIQYLREHVEGGRLPGDWVDAVVVALHCLREESQDKKFSALKIVLFSDLGGEAGLDQVETIIKGMKDTNVEFNHIGPKWLEDKKSENGGAENGFDEDNPKPSTSRGEPDKSQYTSKPQTAMQKQNADVLAHMIVELDGISTDLDEAMGYFICKNKKAKKPQAFKICFEVGPDIRINMVGFKNIKHEPPKSWKRCLARPTTGVEDGQELKPVSRLVTNDENQTEVEPDEVIIGYRYGDYRCIITQEDEDAVKFDGGPRAMCLFGFINNNQIKFEDLVGDGATTFIPLEGDDNSSVALSVLGQAMLEEGVVAIVRKVYSKSSAPRLGVLAPEHDEDGELILAYAELPFSEDLRELPFASLENPRRPLTEEQLDAVDELIDRMDLEVENEDGETEVLVNPENTLNPGYQYLYSCLTAKAINKDLPLPPIPQRLIESLEVPSLLTAEGRLEPTLQRLRNLFPLEEVVKEKGKRTGEKVFGTKEGTEPEEKKQRLGDEEDEETRIFNVGTVNPVDDFNYLLSNSSVTGASIESTGLQLESVVDRLLASAFGTDLNPKIVSCLQAYRQACKDLKKPTQFNDFIRTVKDKVAERLWTDIVAANIGLLRGSEVFEGAEDADADSFLKPQQDGSGNGDKQQDEEEEEEDAMDLI